MKYYLLLFLLCAAFVVACGSQVYHNLTIPHDIVELILDIIIIIILAILAVLTFIFGVGTYIEQSGK
jgi:hypothetical protein